MRLGVDITGKEKMYRDSRPYVTKTANKFQFEGLQQEALETVFNRYRFMGAEL